MIKILTIVLVIYKLLNQFIRKTVNTKKITKRIKKMNGTKIKIRKLLNIENLYSALYRTENTKVFEIIEVDFFFNMQLKSSRVKIN